MEEDESMEARRARTLDFALKSVLCALVALLPGWVEAALGVQRGASMSALEAWLTSCETWLIRVGGMASAVFALCALVVWLKGGQRGAPGGAALDPASQASPPSATSER